VGEVQTLKMNYIIRIVAPCGGGKTSIVNEFLKKHKDFYHLCIGQFRKESDYKYGLELGELSAWTNLTNKFISLIKQRKNIIYSSTGINKRETNVNRLFNWFPLENDLYKCVNVRLLCDKRTLNNRLSKRTIDKGFWPFTGLSYEQINNFYFKKIANTPLFPCLHLNTAKLSIRECVNRINEYMKGV
jgi:hypothetical protein